jgi:hypothetical protein
MIAVRSGDLSMKRLIRVLLTVLFGRPLTPPWPWENVDRRRVSSAQRRAREPMAARLRPETVGALAPGRDQRRLRWIAVGAMIAALLAGGLLASPSLEFDPLDSLVTALLPRV